MEAPALEREAVVIRIDGPDVARARKATAAIQLMLSKAPWFVDARLAWDVDRPVVLVHVSEYGTWAEAAVPLAMNDVPVVVFVPWLGRKR